MKALSIFNSYIVRIAGAVALFMLGGFLSMPANGQSRIGLSTMTIALWPEYDKSGVLVIYRGELEPDVPLPVDIVFRIPAAAGKPSATAGVDDQGNFRYRQYQMVVQGEWISVSYNLPYRRFQFEYYYDPLLGQDENRQFDFVYIADYSVRNFTFEVQEPSGSTDFSTTPVATSTSVTGRLPLRTLFIGPLEQGRQAAVSIRYRKTDPRLSAEVLGLPTPSSVEFEDVAKPAPMSSSLISQAWPIVLGAALIGGIGFGVWQWARRDRRQSRQARRLAQRRAGQQVALRTERQTGSPASRTAVPPSKGLITGFCHYCGRGLKSDELFCPACGTRRRK